MPNITVVLDMEPRQHGRHPRAYVLGSAHIYAEGRSPEEAVGNLLLQNPRLFECSIRDHCHYAVNTGRVWAVVPSHPDHQLLMGSRGHHGEPPA